MQELRLTAREIIDMVIPSPATQKLRFLTIWFGANDSRLPDTPGTPQHIPLEQYVSNMRKIITHSLIQAHEGVRIMVLTPPPVEETLQWNLDREKFPDLKSPRRVVESNAAYAKAVRELANELGVVCLDVWSILIKKTGYDSAGEKPLPGSRSSGIDPMLADLLRDGLHFNPAGYKVVYDELMALIAKTWPDQRPDELPFVLPAWDHPSAWS
ncbi:hypothetical protein AMS68_005464 [Peltaster fructicola]|uniref:SGNH hydrolase-type esterase domain-containing protein n=1 Tax=Peltaster fructicola TaxID=286661 RepID=A0A6H0XYW8_9PEZI|nr:hypothetical protein AMS68_005464 [Peltaster fructicola]